jgi:hypothetical protein
MLYVYNIYKAARFSSLWGQKINGCESTYGGGELMDGGNTQLYPGIFTARTLLQYSHRSSRAKDNRSSVVSRIFTLF